MKLPLRYGLVLLLLLVVGSGLAEGQQRLLLLLAAMGAALWTAFSLPHPGADEPGQIEEAEEPDGIEEIEETQAPGGDAVAGDDGGNGDAPRPGEGDAGPGDDDNGVPPRGTS